MERQRTVMPSLLERFRARKRVEEATICEGSKQMREVWSDDQPRRWGTGGALWGPPGEHE